MNKFDALTELPFCCDYNFKDFYNMYPDAQFILTTRNEDKWLNSTIKYKRMMDIIIDKFPGYGMFTKNFKKFDFSIDSFIPDRYESIRINGKLNKVLKNLEIFDKIMKKWRAEDKKKRDLTTIDWQLIANVLQTRKIEFDQAEKAYKKAKKEFSPSSSE